MWTRLSDRALSLYVRLRVGLAGLLEDARGLQTLEWVALAIVILALLGAAAAYLKNSGEGTVGKAIADAISYTSLGKLRSKLKACWASDPDPVRIGRVGGTKGNRPPYPNLRIFSHRIDARELRARHQRPGGADRIGKVGWLPGWLTPFGQALGGSG